MKVGAVISQYLQDVWRWWQKLKSGQWGKDVRFLLVVIMMPLSTLMNFKQIVVPSSPTK